MTGSRVPLIALLAWIGFAAFGASSDASLRHTAGVCVRDGVQCREIDVPLDWTAARPGQVTLHVEVNRALRPRGVMFLVAGGPGQASSRFIDISNSGFWRSILPGYTLVVFDPRGTGLSDPLARCATTGSARSKAELVAAACARNLGGDRAFYTTADNIRDLEAVRAALGFPRIGIFGVSYGTDVALGYAQAYPARVTRLMLDSVAAPVTDLPVVAKVLQALPRTLTAFCSGVCRGVTSNYGGDVTALAATLDRKPIAGTVRVPGGGRRGELLTTYRFLRLVIETDEIPGLAAEMPAAVHAARGGNPLPLLRLEQLVVPPDGLLFADPVYVATSCDDGPFPWQADTPLAQRPALLATALAALPAHALGGFGPSAAEIGNATMCLRWPVAAAPAVAPAAAGPVPNVPVLVTSGSLDLRGPRAEARAVVARFPKGHLLSIVNIGHSALSVVDSTCVSAAVRAWLAGGIVPRTCRSPRELGPIGAFPPAARTPRTPTQLLSLVESTVRDAEAMCLIGAETRGTISGLQTGKLTVGESGFSISGYGIAGGVTLTGELRVHSRLDEPETFQGVLTVDERGKAVGSIAVNAAALDGVLGGVPLDASRFVPPSKAAPYPGWSTWTPPPGPSSLIASEIAAHVAAEYRVTTSGALLETITAGPPTSPTAPRTRPLAAIAVAGERRDIPYSYHVTSGTWTYTLCGLGRHCAITPGPPTALRGRLVRRQALELALYTFRYDPSITSVVVYLPPSFGLVKGDQLLYLSRRELAAQLARPLGKTLTRAAVPLPGDADATEAGTIDRLTLPRDYTFRTGPLPDGRDELVLEPSSF